MINQLLTLDARLPIVWQTPSTLQIGFDPPRVVLTDIDDRLLPLLSEINKGISDTGMWMLARQSRIPESVVRTFLENLQPVLSAPPETVPQHFVLDGVTDLTHPAAGVLRGVGCDVALANPAENTAPGEVLMFSHYVPQPHHFHTWLRRDRPHTPIVFTDQAVLIGPRIRPGHSRCLRCHFLGDQENHPHRVALASQVSGRVAHSASPERVRLATWYALQLLASAEPNLAYRLCAATRVLSPSISEATGECSCEGLD